MSKVSHRREAFDDPIYFTPVLPAVALTATVVAFAIFGGLCAIPAAVAALIRRKAMR